jgi:crossover junction endodeoxyribonuclease RusA
MSQAVLPLPVLIETLDFTVYLRVEPQGSKKAIPHKATGRIILIDVKSRELKAFRLALGAIARGKVSEIPWAPVHVPLKVQLDCFFIRPESVKNRRFPSVKPDVDKAARSCLDAMTGIVYADDAQVVQLIATKNYGDREKVRVRVEVL